MTDAQGAIARLEEDLKQSQLAATKVGDLLDNKLSEIYVHYHVLRTIGSTLDLQELLRQVIEIVKKSLPIDRVSVYLCDENGEHLDLVHASGQEMPQKEHVQIGQGTPGRIAKTGEQVYIPDLSVFYDSSNDFIHSPAEKKRDGCYLGMALKAHDTTIGIIGMDSLAKNGLGADERDFLAILSHQISAGIEKSLLYSKLQHLSQHDGLTTLFNHRVFQERLRQEISRRIRTRKPLALMMFDIDHFKDFNDAYGHQAGDAVLKELSGIVLQQTRSSSTDTCCRYGGEEFAVIMAETERQNAVMVAERVRKAVQDHIFTINGGTRLSDVTISLGVAVLMSEESLTAEEFVRKADDAMYQSKRNGRNRVSYWPVDGEAIV